MLPRALSHQNEAARQQAKQEEAQALHSQHSSDQHSQQLMDRLRRIENMLSEVAVGQQHSQQASPTRDPPARVSQQHSQQLWQQRLTQPSSLRAPKHSQQVAFESVPSSTKSLHKSPKERKKSPPPPVSFDDDDDDDDGVENQQGLNGFDGYERRQEPGFPGSSVDPFEGLRDFSQLLAAEELDPDQRRLYSDEGEQSLIFHVLNHLLLIYICKLHLESLLRRRCLVLRGGGAR